MIKSNNVLKLFFVFLLLFLFIGLTACESADEKAAKAVDEIIDTLPAEVTLDHENDILGARLEYDNLTENQKELVTKLDDLEEKEATLSDLKAVKAVKDLIAALPLEVVLTDFAAIQAARTAYNALKATLKPKVDNLSKLTAAEAAHAALLDNQEQAGIVKAMITALPSVVDLTLDDEEEVVTAKEAYDVLAAAAKALVDNSNKLNEVVARMTELKADEANLEAAGAVDLLIVALPAFPALSDSTAAEAARAAYNALTDVQKELVTGLQKLEDCERKISDLAAAQVVIDLIAALPDVVDESDEDDIVAVRTAYEDLTTIQQALIINYDLFLEKEKDLEIVKNPDLAVLYPLLSGVPDKIVDDFVLPIAEGVTWSYKSEEDQTNYDIDSGKVLKTFFGDAIRTLLVTYGETTLEVKVNFGLVGEDQIPVYYCGGVVPEEGNAWDGFGSPEIQKENTGFAGVYIVLDERVFFIGKNSFIAIEAEEDNQVITREELRPHGLSAQTDYNNIGMTGGAPVAYKGAGILYYNASEYAVKFDASDTYGRGNNGSLGFGKVPINNVNGKLVVGVKLADHSGNDDTGTTGQLVVTLEAGAYLWCPHGWDVDYNAAGSTGYGSKLHQVFNGYLVENTEVEIGFFKVIE